MVDASKGFIKDGNKNRLREMDLHRIVDVFNHQAQHHGYSKMVSFAEIEKNEFNLNIPRYIDSSESEDIQDIEAHLLGDIPKTDIDALKNYWVVFPQLKNALFTQAKRSNKYLTLQVEQNLIKQTIFEHDEFIRYTELINEVFEGWRIKTQATLKELTHGFNPKKLIHSISENLLSAYCAQQIGRASCRERV